MVPRHVPDFLCHLIQRLQPALHVRPAACYTRSTQGKPDVGYGALVPVSFFFFETSHRAVGSVMLARDGESCTVCIEG